MGHGLRLREKNPTLNRGKCEFNKDTIEFYGFIFGKGGVSPEPKKVTAVLETPAPTNAKEMRSFLGLTNYVSRFIPDYASLTKPLRDLTRKDEEWQWTTEHDKAFRELKTRLTQAEVMKYFDPSLPTEVVVDASPFGLGAILTQRDNDKVYTIAYASRALTPVESRYSQTEREALAVVWACEHFHLYLLGEHFTVISDHKPLEAIYNSPSSRTSARLERWNLRLQAYDFTLKYRPGSDNPADFLSRQPVGNADDKSSREAKVAEEYVNFLVNHSVPKAVTLQQVADATKEDQTLQAVIHSLKTELWHMPTCVPDEDSFQIFKSIKSELAFSEEKGVLLRGTQLVIPKKLQQRVIDIAHEGHQGIIKTKKLLREKVWFPRLDNLVEATVKCCLACLSTTKEYNTEPLKMTPLPTAPWTEVSIDFAGPFPSGDYIMVVTDDYSRYPEIEILSSVSARAVIPKLDAIFARHGCPDVVKSDNGSPFNSHEFAQFAEYIGFKHRKITPFWPQANGGAERCMPMMKKVVQTAQIEQKPWKQELFKFLRNYRATPHSTTGISPAEALFNRKMKVKLPEINSPNDHLDLTIRQNDTDNKKKMKNYADARSRAHTSEIQVGDTVLPLQPRRNKYTPPYNPVPHQVTARKGSMITAGCGDRQLTRNSSFFKKIPTTAPDPVQASTSADARLPDNYPDPIPVRRSARTTIKHSMK